MKRTVPMALLLLAAGSSYGQTAITAANIDTTTSSASTSYSRPRAQGASTSAFPSQSNYRYQYGSTSGFSDNVKTLKSFVAGGAGYTYSSGITTVVKIRRVENAAFNAYWQGYGTPEFRPTPRDLAYYESQISNDTIRIKAPYTPKMEDLFQSNNIAIGIDNIFANDPVTNFNNIERVDVVIPAGLQVQVPAAQGFALFERGNYNEHDPCVVALVTAIDGNGNPTAYAPAVVRVQTGDYYDTSFTSNKVYQPATGTNMSWTILRRDSTNAQLRASDKVSLSQGIGGVMIKFSDFGVTSGTTVYGYSVLAGDFPATGTGANVVNYQDTVFFPTRTPGTTMYGGNDMSVITGIVKILNISGKVFHDANGLTDGFINGPGIGNPSGTQLYVNLVDAAGKVVGSTPVDNTTGTFTLEKLAFGPLTAQLSTTPGVIGQTAPASGLPSGWVSAGENYGTNNRAGSGNESGTPNSVIAINIGDQNITNVQFGIQGRPVSDPKSYSINQPISGQTIPLNGSWTGSTPPDQLTGNDPEDAPQARGFSGNSLRTVVITNLPANGQLLYNGSPVVAGQPIPNYNKDLLSLKLTGTGYTSVSFTYAFRDAAGAQSQPAAYQINWGAPLPVQFLSFEAAAQQGEVKLAWRTASEQHNRGFHVEKSLDGKSWSKIGFVATAADQGNSSAILDYGYSDKSPAQGISFYRLKQEDADGKYTYSDVRRVVLSGDAQSVIVYPNPATDKVYFRINDWTQIKAIRLYDMQGRLMLSKDKAPEGLALPVPAGHYQVQLVHTDGTTESYKLNKQ